MEGNRHVWHAFLLPIISVSFIIGILCARFIALNVVGASAIIFGSILWARRSLDWWIVIVFAFFGGVVRAHFPWMPSIYNPFEHFRSHFDSVLKKFFSGPELTLLSGILFGGSQGFTKQWRTIFVTTGTMHIIAVSGSNLSFYVRWLGLLLKNFCVQAHRRLYITLTLLGIYIALTGAPASVVRAGIMALLVTIAPLLGRQTSAIHALAAAAFFMTLIDPLIARDIGFQLSCMATLGLMLFDNGKTSFARLLQETIAATICVLPIESFYFGRISIVALIANTLVAPFIPIIMSGGLCMFVMAQLPVGLNFFYVRSLNFILHLMLHILSAAALLPGAVARVQISLKGVIVCYAFFTVHIFFRYKKQCRI